MSIHHCMMALWTERWYGGGGGVGGLGMTSAGDLANESQTSPWFSLRSLTLFMKIGKCQ